jgi:hypothetical protein
MNLRILTIFSRSSCIDPPLPTKKLIRRIKMQRNSTDNQVNDFDFSGDNSVDSILQSERKRWTLLNGNTITYSFINEESAPLYPEQFWVDDKGKKFKEPITPISPETQNLINEMINKVFGAILPVEFNQKKEIVISNRDNIPELTEFGTLRIMNQVFTEARQLKAAARGEFPGNGDLSGDLYLSSPELSNIQ